MNQHQKDSGGRNYFIICGLITLLSAALFYKIFSLYIVSQAEKNIQNLLLSHKGIHHYIQRVMLPALFKYKQEGKLSESFYAPELLSSSYIVRNQHQFYNQERLDAGFPEIYYKLAAINPRNPINKADALEAGLIGRFNRDRSLTKVKEIVDIGGEKFLYLAMPFLQNEKQCLLCHGKRADSPQELQALYPGEGGFNEQLGEIRAITSIRAPLHEENHAITAVLAAVLIGAFSFLSLVVFNKRLANKVEDRTAQLQEKERKLRNFLESTSSAPWELDLASGRFTLMGPQIEKILGYPADSWQDLNTWRSRLHPEDRDLTSEFCAAESAKCHEYNVSYRALHADGSSRWLRDVVSVVSGDNGPEKLIGFTHDISAYKKIAAEKKELESRLQQAQKMEAIGTMAGGIAHDFNNILAVILGYAGMAKEDAPPESRLWQDLDRILLAADRARDLVKQILTFSRQAKVERMLLSPQPILKEALKMLRAAIPSTISIKDNITTGCGCLNADPTQLHQILMNLCTNAYHAMEETGGTLTVGLKTADQLPVDFAASQKLLPADFMELSVSDTGCGIAPEVKDKIFEPFFTTKEVGKGTGMGLAITYGIVHDYGGTIAVDSEPGKGSTFHLYFPKSRSEIKPAVIALEPIPHGSERILFVDDEVFLCEMTRDMLLKLGYSVSAHQNSSAALEEFVSHPDAFDLVITDHTMPGMTGLELCGHIQRLRPELPIILCTGHNTLLSAETAKAHGATEFIMKPIGNDNLARLIRKTIDAQKN